MNIVLRDLIVFGFSFTAASIGATLSWGSQPGVGIYGLIAGLGAVWLSSKWLDQEGYSD